MMAQAAKAQETITASLGGTEALTDMMAQAAKAQETITASLGGTEALTDMMAQAAKAQETITASLGGTEALTDMMAQAAKAQETITASLGGTEALTDMMAQAAKAQETITAKVADPIRHLQRIFADDAVEVAKAHEALTSQVTQVAKTHQAFAAKVDEVAKAQGNLASMIADSATTKNLQFDLGSLHSEALGSLAMSESLLGLAGLAATRIEAAGFTDHFASALEDVVNPSSRADVVARLDASETSSDELLADHDELARLVGPGLDPVTTRVLLAVLVVASLPFIADAVITISLAILSQCWTALRLVAEVTRLDPAIPGLLTLLTILGVTYRRD